MWSEVGGCLPRGEMREGWFRVTVVLCCVLLCGWCDVVEVRSGGYVILAGELWARSWALRLCGEQH